ncbi:MAG: hypothetical protein GY804_01085 [Alphaproteobacteria bacterium]|nr:hypothetical protein [Alphaproteobacteria bacterium]
MSKYIDQLFVEREEDIPKTKDELNTLLNLVSMATYNQAVNTVITIMDQFILSRVDTALLIRESAQGFYQENPELLKHKVKVQACLDEIIKEHKDWSMEQIIKGNDNGYLGLANHVKKVLDIKE